MKKKLDMMNMVDDDLIERANPESIKPKKNTLSLKMISAIAACLVIAAAVINLAIFLPMGNDETPIIGGDSTNSSQGGTSGSDTTGSQGTSGSGEGGEDTSLPSTGYEAIKNLLEANRQPQYGGSVDGSADIAPGLPEMDEDASSPDGDGSGGEYVEVTDNQVAGVIEADIFKRTKTHIFYLRGANICAYTIDGEGSCLVGELQFTDTYSYGSYEMYLSEDGKIATIIHSKNHYPNYETCVSLIDVSRPEEMKIAKCTTIKGQYEDSRYVNGELLVFTRFLIKNTDKTENYIPAVDEGSGFELLAPEQIIVPEKINGNSYLVVSKISGNTLSYTGSLALLSFDSTLYVSQSSIYATRGFGVNHTSNKLYKYGSKTEIVRISYTGDLLNVEGSVTVNGSIKDQYCMDEHNGILRVFTTVREGQYLVYNGGAEWDESVSNGNTSSGTASSGVAVSPSGGSGSTQSYSIVSASLYCIEIGEGMTVVASVECFAPKGETVQSARFDGDSAYVCTAIVFTDPVFVFDLSDLENITYKDTGVIEGYSHSLIELEGGRLLGIGESDWSTVKLELYAEGETGLISLSKVELQDTYCTSEYKSYYINREKMVFGFVHMNYGDGAWFYSIYKIVDDEIVLQQKTKLHQGSYMENSRGVLIEDCFYILTDAKEMSFTVIKIGE